MEQQNSEKNWLNAFKNLQLSVIAEIIAGLIVVVITTTLAPKIFSSLANFTILEKTLLGLLIATILGFVVYNFRRIRNRYIPNFGSVDFDFEIIEKEITHRYLSQNKLVHKRKWILKALRNGLTFYTDRFNWTGGNSIMRTDINGHQVIKTGTKNVFDEYNYKFHRALNKNEIIEIEVIWELDNNESKAIPFFSTPINEPTHLLKMNFEIPPTLGVKKVVCEICGTSAQKILKTSEVELDREGKYTWRVPNPKLFHQYEVNWII
jgi:hypothetical protein